MGPEQLAAGGGAAVRQSGDWPQPWGAGPTGAEESQEQLAEEEPGSGSSVSTVLGEMIPVTRQVPW